MWKPHKHDHDKRGAASTYPRNRLGENQYSALTEWERNRLRIAAAARKRARARETRDRNRAAGRCLNDTERRTHALPRAGRAKCDPCLATHRGES